MGFPGLLNVFLTPSTLGVVAAVAIPGREDSMERVGPMLGFSGFSGASSLVRISPGPSPSVRGANALEGCRQLLSMVLVARRHAHSRDTAW